MRLSTFRVEGRFALAVTLPAALLLPPFITPSIIVPLLVTLWALPYCTCRLADDVFLPDGFGELGTDRGVVPLLIC
ncbi:MAG: hypothetical protein NZ703_14140 [Gemmataceae bacterium]|nr:hypothetical protein [Gemmataceae bacterium]